MNAHQGVGQSLHKPISRPQERCPTCGRRLTTCNFDMTFRHTDGGEQLCFAIPAGLCDSCDELHINPALVATLGLEAARLVFAIGTDRVAMERHMMRAD